MPMETPNSITPLDKKEAKRRFLTVIDFTIDELSYDIVVDKQAYGSADPSKQRLLDAMLDQRNLLARQWTFAERLVPQPENAGIIPQQQKERVM